jgi:hypothetical protein
MRAVGDESRPPCHKKKGSLLSCDRPSKLFDLQDSVGRKVVLVPLEAALERNCRAEVSSRIDRVRRYEQARFGPLPDYSKGPMIEMSAGYLLSLDWSLQRLAGPYLAISADLQ